VSVCGVELMNRCAGFVVEIEHELAARSSEGRPAVLQDRLLQGKSIAAKSSGTINLSDDRTERISLSTLRMRSNVQSLASSAQTPPNAQARASVLSSRSKVRGKWLGLLSDQAFSCSKHSTKVWQMELVSTSVM